MIPSNGLLIASHLHQCFDQRLFSIHPDTDIIRVFMPYSLLMQYHGRPAALPPGLSRRALRLQYDMCCIENFGAMYPMPSAPAPIISIRSNAAKLPVSSSFAVSGDLDKVQNHSTAGTAPTATQGADASSCAGGFDYAEKHKQTSAVELPPTHESSRPPAEDAHHRTRL
ncbi:uncharacterized protein PgNI_11644 [Pyricularia grisea]|uniref:HNH nuclease domain-containing protein n=1 Tax=Pyricularia grisea TaxID=148305 RepID=A0A6P8ANK9_PYRGI|nr:uncharacterized protein PgNI_11644 [Pyricularia grisea]TLD03619.1 hypothetical protein PgNI_11644 [Pyricularia grisea]